VFAYVAGFVGSAVNCGYIFEEGYSSLCSIAVNRRIELYFTIYIYIICKYMCVCVCMYVCTHLSYFNIGK
jgi:hypothetical protein